jgi:hypothetical protein
VEADGGPLLWEKFMPLGAEKRSRATLRVSISRPAVDVDTLGISSHESYDIAFRPISRADLDKICIDSELFNSLLREKPEEVVAMVNDLVAGRTDKARNVARSIGFTEEDFQRQGGGLIFWAGIIVCGIMIYAAAATRP